MASPSRQAKRAHPRSRGENFTSRSWALPWTGSSPLTRGKLGAKMKRALSKGLIPAHAGKTTTSTTRAVRHAAHPRSRGENSQPTSIMPAGMGSSPLTRGKQGRGPRGCGGSGLIPAHAGKTSTVSARPPRNGAHPRSRGENDLAVNGNFDGNGSSPLTRGKRVAPPAPPVGPGLIPAHAGKTTPPS